MTQLEAARQMETPTPEMACAAEREPVAKANSRNRSACGTGSPPAASDEVIGQRVVEYFTRAVSTPGVAFRVTAIEPATLTVNVDQLVERELPVQPRLTGDPPAGLAVERVAVIPARVKLTGPRTLLENSIGMPCPPAD